MSYKKIVVISDTHGFSFADKIPECDILIHCGDISPVNLSHDFYTQQQWFLNTFVNELKLIPAKEIVFIAGNHDTYLHEINISDGNSKRINNILPNNCHYLCNESLNVFGLNIYGSPWVSKPSWARKNSPVWNFSKTDDDLKDIYFSIPFDLDILITHGPCFGFCDTILQFGSKERLGSKSLLNSVLKKQPKIVVNGHIHSANHKIETFVHNLDLNIKTNFFCTSILDEDYNMREDIKPLILNFNDREFKGFSYAL